ncbi:zinc ribbon domain-containing protein [Altericista sp. CCNU0014]|uniref:double zinc ribbon domain-containing protein n=1 Tax=Altericista sp. CCNU0014 TaxID=3082949 RepID=UPI00384CFC9F
MFSLVRRLFRQLIHRSTHINHESINKASIIILILIDVFVLFNVFGGLENIGQLILSPQEEFPCFSSRETYQNSKQKGTFDFDAKTIENLIDTKDRSFPHVESESSKRIGKISILCETEIRLIKEINTTNNIKLKTEINQDRTAISNLNQEIETLRRQYDSTLLEKIAGQSPQDSINKASADRVKAKIDEIDAKISVKKQEIVEVQKKLVRQPYSEAYLKLLNDTTKYKQVKEAYSSARFWYPNKQLFLQTLFLLPLIIIAYFVNLSATKRNKAVLALISWHLLLIFCIPLLVKFFEFIQFGNLLGFAIEQVTILLGGLKFIANYLLILLVPLAGFGLIKFLQKFVFNPKVQARARIQNARCINCSFKLARGDEFCPSCGFNQLMDCPNCSRKTYKFTRFCKHCGHSLEQISSLKADRRQDG